MKTTIYALAVTAIGSIAMANSTAALADASRIGDSVTIGCTLPYGVNGSTVYSVDKKNALGNDIEFNPTLGDNQGIGQPCQQVINKLTPKTATSNIFQSLILNCGQTGGLFSGLNLGVWQAAGQSPANPFWNDDLTGVLLAAQVAPPGPAQPVLLAPPTADSNYALVSYTFVCALDVGNMSLFAINATQP